MNAKCHRSDEWQFDFGAINGSFPVEFKKSMAAARLDWLTLRSRDPLHLTLIGPFGGRSHSVIGFFGVKWQRGKCIFARPFDWRTPVTKPTTKVVD
jgi:hypothetical protein